MDSKFFDIPFRVATSDPDFVCKDGEIASAENVRLICEGEETEIENQVIPPVPDIDFALVREVLHGWHIIADNYPIKTLAATTPGLEYWNKLAAQLLEQFRSEAAMQHLFVAPFYVMGAWRTYDGRYLSFSQPQLLVPNSEVPAVTTDGGVSSSELDFKIAAAVCGLYFRMRAPEILRDWVGKIECLDILVSDPLVRYDNFDSLIPFKRTTTDNSCISLDPVTGTISEKRVCTETLPLAWKANRKVYFPRKNSRDFYDRRFHTFGSIPLSEVDICDTWGNRQMELVPEFQAEYIRYSELTGKEQREESSKPLTIEGTGENIHVLTRPVKLTNATEFNRISKAMLRGKFQPGQLTLTVEGSRDMRCWWTIAKRKGGTVALFPRSLFRFYRFSISGVLSNGENLQGLSITI